MSIIFQSLVPYMVVWLTNRICSNICLAINESRNYGMEK